MLILLDKYWYPGKHDLGLSPVNYNVVSTLMATGMRVRSLYMDHFSGPEEFEKCFTEVATGEDLIWISSVMSPLLTRSLLRWIRKRGLKIVMIFTDAIRLMAPTKNYRIY